MKIEHGIYICRQSLHNAKMARKNGKRIFKLSHFKGRVHYQWGKDVDQIIKGYTKGWSVVNFSFLDYFKVITFTRVHLTSKERKKGGPYYYNMKREKKND